jgi:hypothetical protein
MKINFFSRWKSSKIERRYYRTFYGFTIDWFPHDKTLMVIFCNFGIEVEF